MFFAYSFCINIAAMAPVALGRELNSLEKVGKDQENGQCGANKDPYLVNLEMQRLNKFSRGVAYLDLVQLAMRRLNVLSRGVAYLRRPAGQQSAGCSRFGWLLKICWPLKI
jgi:hypothetical protein